jgi:hypothetical protein
VPLKRKSSMTSERLVATLLTLAPIILTNLAQEHDYGILQQVREF